MFGRRKKTYGLKAKALTREEFGQQYNAHALQLGHKYRLVHQLNQDIEKLEVEIAQHKEQLIQLHADAMKLPPEQQPPTPVHNFKEGQVESFGAEGTGA